MTPEQAVRIRLSSVGFALLLLLPLVWVPGYGFDGVRLPLFLALVTLLLGRRAFRGGGRRGPAPLLAAALILLGANVMSLAVARSPGEAAAPLLILFGGVALFSVVREGSVDREFVVEGVPILLAIVGLVLAAIGFYQRLSGLPVVSTEGNSNYSGALAGMLIPLLAALTAAGRRRWLWGLSAAALLALLLLSESRGGWLGAVAGTGVAAGALLWKRLPGARAAVVAIVCLVAIPLALQGRRQLSEARSDGVTFRIEAWKGALRMMSDRPILGAGPGNFAVEYPPYRSEVEFRASHAHAPAGTFKEVEDAHSIWAQAAAETGSVGLLALLLMVYVAARLWRYHVKAAVEPEEVALLAGLGGGAAAFLVAG
ncbi:MAG TPA: O-antigen ligase family protein, partial [Planctomycetota bacterium]|nr:O-antigen ligase family protein [Planctomycetota bacterium]